MFFILSKLLTVLIFPISWIFILLIWSFITKSHKRKQRLLLVAIIVFIIFSNSFLFSRCANAWDIDTHNLPSKKYSCAIVLGGFTSFDADGNGYFNAAADRFIQGIKLQKTGVTSKILISGGSAGIIKNKFKEADYVYTQLKALNIADSSILIENQSRNTIENAQYSKRLLQKQHVPPPYLLITSAFHMRRAIYTFKKYGIDVVPYSCDFIAGKEEQSIGDFILPNSDALNKWNFYIKEMIGYVVYHFKA